MKKFTIQIFVLGMFFLTNQADAKGRVINKTGINFYVASNGIQPIYLENNGVVDIPYQAKQVYIYKEQMRGAFDTGYRYTLNNPKTVDYVVTIDMKSAYNPFIVKEAAQPVKSSAVQKK